MTITNCQSGLYYFWDDKLQRKKKARKRWRKQERKRQYERQSRARPADIFQSLNTEMWSTDSMACKQLAFIYSSTLPLGQLHKPVKFDAFSNSSYWKDIRSFQNSLKKNTFPWHLFFSIIFVILPILPYSLLAIIYRIASIYYPKQVTPAMRALKKTQQLMPSVVPRENQTTHWVTEDSIFIFSEFSRVSTICSLEIKSINLLSQWKKLLKRQPRYFCSSLI